jgi:hypothetical protein
MEQEAYNGLAIPEPTAVLRAEGSAEEGAETRVPKAEGRPESEARVRASNNGSIGSSGTTPARCST